MKLCQKTVKFQLCAKPATHSYITPTGHRRNVCPSCKEILSKADKRIKFVELRAA